MQAIITKFLPASDLRGIRVEGTCDAGTITVGYNYRLNDEENHRSAALAIVDAFGCSSDHCGAMIGGQMPGDLGYCWVFPSRRER